MHVDELLFLYLALPFALALYRLCSVRVRPVLLVIFSAVMYWSVEGRAIVVPVAVIACDCVIARLMALFGGYKTRQKILVAVSAVKSAGVILGFGIAQQLYGLHVPMGTAVVCLASLGYILDIHRGFIAGDAGAVRVALLCGFFPGLYAGPLATYGRMAFQYNNLQMSLEKISRGAMLYACGLARKLILADNMQGVYKSVCAIPQAEMTVLAAWCKAIFFLMVLYFTLWGYSDMARGLGLMFGFELPENFNSPFRATSINDFFTRFNITVNRYFRRHIYSVLGGAKGSFWSGACNILLMNILIGLWFGISLNMVAWGVFFAVFVILERYVLLSVLPKVPAALRWLYANAVVLFSAVIFTAESAGAARQSFAAMLGFGAAGFLDNQILYLLASHAVLILMSLLCMLGFPRSVSAAANELVPGFWNILRTGCLAALLAAITIFMF